jgi:hypothetical protein
MCDTRCKKFDLFTYLFNDADNRSDYKASNDRFIGKQSTGRIRMEMVVG